MCKRWTRCVVFVAVLLLGMGCTTEDDTPAGGPCSVGETVECACDDGHRSDMVCGLDGVFGMCRCPAEDGGASGQTADAAAGGGAAPDVDIGGAAGGRAGPDASRDAGPDAASAGGGGGGGEPPDAEIGGGDGGQPPDAVGGGGGGDAPDEGVADAGGTDAGGADAGAGAGGADDDAPPEVEITAPVDGAYVSGDVSVVARADDDDGVLEVRFFVGAGLLSADNAVPYGATWPSGDFAEGRHRLRAVALDTAMQSGEAEIDVVVDRTAPLIELDGPDSVVGGALGLEAIVADASPIAEVRIAVDGGLRLTLREPPWAAEIDVSELASGQHLASATVVDAAGNEAEASVAFTVDRAPTVAFVRPIDDAIVEGPTEIEVDAADDLGLDAVEIFVDGDRLGAADVEGRLLWEPGLLVGPHTLRAVARDSIGQVAEAQIAVHVRRNLDIEVRVCTVACAVVGDDPLAAVAGLVRLEVSSSGAVPLATVSFEVDGEPLGVDAAPPFRSEWDADAAGEGRHPVRIEATDADGETTEIEFALDVAGCDSVWFRDADLDGYGDDDLAEIGCDAPVGFVERGGDCEDGDRDIHPRAFERCNGVDDDCDARIDEDLPPAALWFLDRDGDGFGDPGEAQLFCGAAPAGFIDNDDDCDDDNEGRHPAADDVCDGTDDNCRDDEDDCAECDDRFEPNDTRATAQIVPPATHEGLAVCAGSDQDDWFAVDLEANEIVDARVTFEHRRGDIDLALYDDEGNRLRRSVSVTDDERVGHAVEAPGRYFVHVYMFDARANPYALTIEVSAIPACADPLEPDDRPEDATPLEPGLSAEAVMCAADDDWFSFEPSDGARAAGLVVETSGLFAPRVTLYDDRFAVLDEVDGLDVESASVRVAAVRPPGRSFFARLRLDEGPPRAYTATWFETICADDGAEDDDDIHAARALGIGAVPREACGGDPDVFLFTAPDSGIFRFTLEQPGEVRLTLDTLDPETGLVLDHLVGASASRAWYVRNGDEIGLRVQGPLDAATEYVLRTTRDVAPPFADCADRFEPNDVRDMSVTPGEGAFGGLDLCPQVDTDDWYSVLLSEGEQFAVDMSFDHAIGDLDLEVYDPDDELVGRSDSLTDDEALAIVAQQTGTHRVRAIHFSGLRNEYAIEFRSHDP